MATYTATVKPVASDILLPACRLYQFHEVRVHMGKTKVIAVKVLKLWANVNNVFAAKCLVACF